MISAVRVLSVGEINIVATKILSALDILLALLDYLLNSPFGLLLGKQQILNQISGLLGAAASLQVAVVDPRKYLADLLAMLAALQAALGSGIASFIRDLTPQISANVMAIAALQANLAGILGLLDLAFLGKLAALNAVLDLREKLASGGVAVYVGKDAPIPTMMGELIAHTAAMPPGFTGLPNAYGIFILCENPTTIEALKTLFLLPDASTFS